MERRSFLKQTGLGGVALGAAALSGQAVAADGPKISWRLASSFPKSLDTIYGAAEVMAEQVSKATNGNFKIQSFAAGELVPGPQVLDAVKDGTVAMGHTCSYYFVGKDPTFAFDTAAPFGLNSRQQTAWMLDGGGHNLMSEFFNDYNIVSIPCGNTGTQMGGWFRKEIKTVKDLSGLKMRIGGFAGKVMAKLGAIPQQIPGGDIYPSLEKGTIDAAEWVGPYDDLRLGFNKVAKYYYYPGWWEGGAQLSAYINKKEYDALPANYKVILDNACAYAHNVTQARYDARNPAALKELIAGGAQLRPFPNEVMVACYKATQEVYKETSAENPRFAKVFKSWDKFRQDQIAWYAVAENRFSSFMQAANKAGK